MKVDIGHTNLTLSPKETAYLAEALYTWKEEHFSTYDPQSEFISELISELYYRNKES
ncbi:hypothetical protein SEA_WEASELS2_17 [Rhodococcus phage Weasels2]|uniref:Uncharacterized protein n=1 Tax=Rhodococcus phage Weasels2 TaxID=1897437 RepID=A0A1I9SA01_9CAUD|nr:hypothetical protein FDH04_gp017 [Rhodococcus phage Weasels2]AOZ63607.1 hypothetical protein SEA_WEASELS2_17 [Rhodococcus phage Weasels2]